MQYSAAAQGTCQTCKLPVSPENISAKLRTVLVSQLYRRSPGAVPVPACAGANSSNAEPASLRLREPSALYSQFGFMTLKANAPPDLYTCTRERFLQGGKVAKASYCNATACVEHTVLRTGCCKAFARGEAITDPILSVHSVGHWCWPCIGKSRVAHCCHSPLRPLQSCASTQCRRLPARENPWSCTRRGHAKLCTDRSSCLHTCNNAPQHLSDRPLSKVQRSVDEATGLSVVRSIRL